MASEYTIKEAPEITAHYTTDEDGVVIESLDIHGEPAGEFLENFLLANHGDRWELEIEAQIKANYEADRAEYQWENRRELCA